MATRMLGWLVIGAAMVAGVGSTVAAQTPTVEEVLKTYRDNREKFSTMHVRMTRTTTQTDAYRLEKRLKAELYEELLKGVEAGEPFEVKADGPIDGAEILNHFRREALEARRDLKEPGVYRDRREFFQDGRRYQTRSWIWSDKPVQGEFLDVRVTPETLITHYNDYNIRSWTEQQTPPGRIWQGHHSSERPTHQLLLTECEVETRASRQPAFFGVKFPVEGSDNPIERFFQGAVENYRVAGAEVVDGRPCVIVECIVHRDGMQEMSRASIDMARGAIPVRVQRWRAQPGATFDMAAKFNLYHLASTKVIREVDPGCWYPVSIIEEEFQPEPEAAMAQQRKGPLVPAGPAPPIPAVAYVHREWDCDLVERSFPHDDDFFVLKFGPDHPITDLEARRREPPAPEPTPLVKAGQAAPPLSVARWLNSDRIALDQLRGRVVVLTFCSLKNWNEHYFSLMSQLRDKYDGREVDFLTICMPEGDAEKHGQAASKFIKEKGWACPVAIDTGMSSETAKTTRAYGLMHDMAIVVIGPDGIVLQNDQEFPEGIDEDEDAAEAWFKEFFVSAGEKWPVPEDMPLEEQKKLSDRVNLFHKSKAIDEALKKIEGVIPVGGTSR